MELQAKAGIPYRDLIQDYQTKLTTREEHERRTQTLASEIIQREAYLRDLNKLKILQENLQHLHLLPDRLNAFVNSHLQLEQLGFSVETATQIAQELRNLRLDPTIAVRELTRLLSEYHSMSSLIEKESKTLQSLKDREFLAQENNRLEKNRAELQGKVEQLTRNRDDLQIEVDSKKAEVNDLNRTLELVQETGKKLGEREEEIAKARPLLEIARLLDDPQHYALLRRETASLTLNVILSFSLYLKAHPKTLVYEEAIKTNLEQITKNLEYEMKAARTL